ncbi:hypothetical protein F441_19128 [Phytophthora nicotianae CJ01A1]|uniref:PPM-type phosphatase domain-containing protein n=6 Tax=Phytophthora nicotianae TaxID=4792 RepID=W2QWR1_PHYN3|nr:hypothetical protein PPTG_05405 [Phytophthora nicotianae INRA-310]ETI34100.1 hypothetical protein F443_19308 [Phytophthora nicotianae P1569]ETK74467.1 hypothetical protein L915_18732 [Phytophthora nicotianae]ETO62909.1 hypothetical protein F444_19259 [Phytophthora nicotianae P1976]ETP03992.1 hypothetical protein F441_19128 [Phytophthora nicotianae CJ01A1]ETP32146.1 hypothetical protein F442_19083 [Phytophthora nicotianae P10297]
MNAEPADPRADKGTKDVAETITGGDTIHALKDNVTNEEDERDEQAASKRTGAATAESKKNGIALLGVGSLSQWGWAERHSNEDRCVVENIEQFHLFAVIDGHAGWRTADFLVEELFKTLDGVYDNSFDQTKLFKVLEELDSKIY